MGHVFSFILGLIVGILGSSLYVNCKTILGVTFCGAAF